MDDLTTRTPAAAHPSLDLLGDLEQRLAGLRQWQEESAQRAAEVERHEAELAERQDGLAREAERLEAARAEAASERAGLEARREEVEAARTGLDEQRAGVEAQSRRLADEAEEAQREREALDAERAQLAEQERRLADERAEVERERTGLEAQAAGLADREGASADLDGRAERLDAEEQRIAARDAELTAEEQRLAEASSALEERSAEHDRRSADLDAFREELETELERLNGLKESLDARELALRSREEAAEASAPADADAAAELTDLSTALDRRTEELAEARAELDRAAAELQSLRDALAAAEEAATEAAAAPSDAGRGPAGVEAMRAELDKRAHNLKRAKKKILELQDEVRSASDRNGESAIFSSGDLDLAEVTRLRMTLEERERELAQARSRLAEREVEVARLTARVEELIKRGARSGSAAPGDTADQARRALELDELAAQVTADRNRVLERKAQLKTADALIKSRREKIRDYIKEFRGNHGRARGSGGGGGGVDPARAAQLEQERTTLLEVKRFLQASEAEMVKRWALQKTATVAATLVIAVAAAAAVSWTAAGVVARPLYQATMTLVVEQAPDEEPLPPGVWLSGYGRDLLSEPVLREVQNQLEQRNLRLAGSPEGLATRLEGSLAVAGDREALEVTFTDPDPSLVTPVLDAVGRGLLIHHMAQDRRAGRMSDTATLTSEAVLRDRPVKDERVRLFGLVLGGFALLALLAAVPARYLAGRARPTLPEGGVPELAALDHPSPLVAEAMQAATPAEDEGDEIKPVFRF